ncbi:MAG TPA: NAD(P)H-binding protein, partial [Dehalococcoidia bacterium]|nr:NAD(P)H-binding protein [Dehalococcoidia bacterium]
MQIVLAGGTGFLGRPLHEALTAEGHGVTILTRHPTRRGLPAGAHVVGWNPDGNVGDWATAVDGVDAVVNLSGEPIAARRWSDAQKKRIRESRILAARSIVGAIQ